MEYSKLYPIVSLKLRVVTDTLEPIKNAAKAPIPNLPLRANLGMFSTSRYYV